MALRGGMMCGRYRLTRKDLREQFDTENDIDWAPRWNIAPTDDVPVVRQDRERPVRKLSLMRWGLIPFWAKDVSIGAKMINARADTIFDKQAFRDAFLMRRCIVPADGFYEWQRKGKQKQAFSIGFEDESVLALGGIWERWKAPDGKMLESCSIITTEPNALMAEVHDRMPLILDRDNFDLWLDPGLRRAEDLKPLLVPFPAERMRKQPISDYVNRVTNEGPQCVESFAAPEPPQSLLF